MGTGPICITHQEAAVGTGMLAAIDIGDASEVLAGGRAVVQVPELGDVAVLVVRTRRGLFAVENSCPHTGRSMSDAKARGRYLTCPGHQSRYRLEAGSVNGADRGSARTLKPYRVWISGGRLYIGTNARASGEEGQSDS
jgi:nitrite reductase/ring-hydroxylating ferredoxin subunit